MRSALVAGAVLILAALPLLFRHHENAREREVRGIVAAIASGDLAPVETAFEPSSYASERARFFAPGARSLVTSRGSVQRVEARGSGTGCARGDRAFVAVFERGELRACVRYAPDHRIERFALEAPR